MRAAAEIAKAKGWPLDQMITLNFFLTDCDEERMPAAFEYVRDMAVRWYRYETDAGRIPKEDQFAFIWSLEHVGDYYHAHWLVHLPKTTGRRFRRMMETWCLRAAGQGLPGYFNMKRFNHMGPIYLTKGMAPDEFVGPKAWRGREGRQGYFRAKRCGISANLRSPRDLIVR